ncbi:MAG TPA: thiol reductant ABC exporter subunit CydC [Acidimicrobiales bacterium]|nr:thiol reductant ABC exporter subunit CydC [Acidimicrobiales bacterium]
MTADAASSPTGPKATTRPLRRVLAEPGTPYGRLALAGALGFAAAAATVGLLAGSGYVIGKAAFRPGLGALAGILAVVEVMAFLRGPLRYAERLVGHNAALRALARWRVWLYDRLTPRLPAALEGWQSGDLLARAVDDVDTLGDLYLRTALPLAVAVATGILGIVVVGVLMPLGALALGIPLAVAAATSVVSAWRRGDHREAAELAGRLSALVVDAIHGAADLVAFGADDDMRARIGTVAAQSDRVERRRSGALARAGLVTHVCLAVAVTAVLALAVRSVHAGTLEPVMVAVLPLAALATFEPLSAVGPAVSRALAVEAAARRLFALDAVPVPVREPRAPRPLAPDTPAVTFRGASLRYRPDRPLALDGVDVSLAPGTHLAVTGSSGAGKSSLVAALLRYWALDAGTLHLGDLSVDEVASADVRRAVALVDQRAHLFAGTVRSNITLGKPDATEAEVDEAVRDAQLSEWVASLPAGLDTPVGDDGTTVSGGERRRLAVARALLTARPILVLDEPTAGLRADQADRLLDDVLASAGNRSVLLVTHRAAEAARCASSLHLEEGRVVE